MPGVGAGRGDNVAKPLSLSILISEYFPHNSSDNYEPIKKYEK